MNISTSISIFVSKFHTIFVYVFVKQIRTPSSILFLFQFGCGCFRYDQAFSQLQISYISNYPLPFSNLMGMDNALLCGSNNNSSRLVILVAFICIMKDAKVMRKLGVFVLAASTSWYLLVSVTSFSQSSCHTQLSYGVCSKNWRQDAKYEGCDARYEGRSIIMKILIGMMTARVPILIESSYCQLLWLLAHYVDSARVALVTSKVITSRNKLCKCSCIGTKHQIPVYCYSLQKFFFQMNQMVKHLCHYNPNFVQKKSQMYTSQINCDTYSNKSQKIVILIP